MENYSLVFEDILELCLADLRGGSRSLGECLAAYPQYRVELEPLLKVSERLNAAGRVTAPVQFSNQAVTRFKANLPAQKKQPASPYPVQNRAGLGNPAASQRKFPAPSFNNDRQRHSKQARSSIFALILTVFLVFVLASTSVALAANSANPGGSFYPVKLAFEKAQLSIAKSDLQEQQLHLKFANRRLREVEYLLEHDRDLLINQPIEDYLDHLDFLNNLLISPNLSDPERVMIATQLLSSPAMNQDTLNALYQQISPEQRAQMITAIRMAQDAYSRAEQVVNGLPDIRNQIRALLLSTVDAGLENTPLPTQPPVNQTPPLRTPQPEPTGYATFIPEWTQIVPGSISNWLTNTPDLSRLATLYPTLYPTISNLATLYPTYYPTLSALATQRPTLKATLRPPVKPTENRPPRPAATRATPNPVPPRPIPTATP